MGLHVTDETFLGQENPAMSSRRAKGWMTLNEAAYYCGCGRTLMAELVRQGEVVSVPSVSARMSKKQTTDPARRVISVDSLDMYMATCY